MPNKKAARRERVAKKAIGTVLKPAFRGVGKALNATGKAINRGLAKVDRHAKKIRKKKK